MTPLGAADLAYIRKGCAYHAYRCGRPIFADDFVSEACLRLVKASLPEEMEHRRRFIRQTIGWAVSDFLRSQTITPRRVLEKLKRGEELTRRERAKIGHAESIEGAPEWAKQLAEETKPDLPDPRLILARIGARHPVEFFVLTMYFIHEQSLAQVAALLEVTESRASQLTQTGIELLRRNQADA